MTEYFVRFVNDLDPSPKSGVKWPKFTTATRSTLSFNDGTPAVSVVADNARMAAMKEVANLSLCFPF